MIRTGEINASIAQRAWSLWLYLDVITIRLLRWSSGS